MIVCNLYLGITLIGAIPASPGESKKVFVFDVTFQPGCNLGYSIKHKVTGKHGGLPTYMGDTLWLTICLVTYLPGLEK